MTTKLEDLGRSTPSGIILDRRPARDRRSKYQWAEWCDGNVRIVRRDLHFRCPPGSFVSTLRSRANSRNMALWAMVGTVDTDGSVVHEDECVTFQFFPSRTYKQGPPE